MLNQNLRLGFHLPYSVLVETNLSLFRWYSELNFRFLRHLYHFLERFLRLHHHLVKAGPHYFRNPERMLLYFFHLGLY